METISHFLKRSEAWVTDLQHRYSEDIFFRTTLHIIGLQAALVVVSVTVFAATLHYTNARVAQTVISHITEIIQHGDASTSAEALTRSISELQANTTLFMLLGIVLIAILSGIVLSYITLRPTRSSLESQKLFISNIAHELRTPLAVIKTSTEVELLDEALPIETKKALFGILDEIERASGVINNLLSLNRLLRPERMEFQNVDMSDIIDRVALRSQRVASERNVEIVTHKSDFSTVSGNAVALEQMVINLTNNAIQYTPKNKNGKVTLTLEPDYSGMIVLSVADSGIGIEREDLYHIFEPFYRADKSRVRKHGGSGLGLAIVNEIVRTHHGKIRIQSTPGKGTVFFVYLPVAHTAPEEIKEEGTTEKNLHEVAMDFSSGGGVNHPS
jgi:signal transduction histidine kinase